MMTGDEARALRLGTGASMTEWATLLGIVPGTVRNIECGRYGPTKAGKRLEQLWRLYAVLHKKEHGTAKTP